ncbi:uncharacterized protein CC84DRAFT_1105555, partial [Paraphaeosphaeria sporulosa]
NSETNVTATHESTEEVVERSPAQQHIGNIERRTGETVKRDAGRWSRFWGEWGSVELENKGSVARYYLALERTFLAWLRTSLSLASIGVAITQLFRLNCSLEFDTSKKPTNATADSRTHSQYEMRRLGKSLGTAFIGVSILMLFVGFHRYFEAQHYVIQGKFPASRGSIIVGSALVVGLIVGSLAAIFAAGAA